MDANADSEVGCCAPFAEAGAPAVLQGFDFQEVLATFQVQTHPFAA